MKITEVRIMVLSFYAIFNIVYNLEYIRHVKQIKTNNTKVTQTRNLFQAFHFQSESTKKKQKSKSPLWDR